MRKKLFIAVGVCLTASLPFALLHCSSTEDESVTIVTNCDPKALRTDDPVEVTARLFFETSNDLVTRAQALEKKFTDVCNAIDSESGDQPGTDIRSACNKIAARLAAAQKLAPVPDGGGDVPVWVHIGWPEDCAIDSQTESACITQCATSPCNTTAGCPMGKQAGTCGAACNGVCLTAPQAQPQACTGECRGTCATPDGGIACSAAECVGDCTATTWTGRCAMGCDNGFLGLCKGTCTGTCDGAPIAGPGSMDAGADDAGDGGDAEAGPPADAGPVVAPGGADGNCPGVCSGQCSSQASGACGAKCRGGFSGGECRGGPARCKGTCTAAAFGCTTTCQGECAFNADGGACAGTCSGGCSGAVTNPSCGVALTCDANVQCKNVCRTKAAIATTCPNPPGIEVRVAGDQAIYDALKKHMPDFAEASVEANLVNSTSFNISAVTLADYKTLGSTRDRVRVCVTAASKNVEQARNSLATSVAASQVTQGIKF